MRPTGRASVLVLLLSALASCGRGGDTDYGDIDTALLTRPGGDVMLEGGRRLPYEITSDRYRAWESARRALRAQRIGLTMRVDPLRVTEADIQKAVDFFERNRRARRAIEGAGLSVRDYVLTTIAVEQQMAVASGRWGARDRPRTAPASATPADTVGAAAGQDTARPRVDTVPVVDTVVVPVDTVPTPPPDTTS